MLSTFTFSVQGVLACRGSTYSSFLLQVVQFISPMQMQEAVGGSEEQPSGVK